MTLDDLPYWATTLRIGLGYRTSHLTQSPGSKMLVQSCGIQE